MKNEDPVFRLNVIAIGAMFSRYLPTSISPSVFAAEEVVRRATVYSSQRRIEMRPPCIYDGCAGLSAVPEWDDVFCSQECAAQYGLQAAADAYDECDRCGQVVPIDEDCLCETMAVAS